MYYTDFTIEMRLTEMRDKAVGNSTPKKFTRPLREGAEIIKQLRKARDEARAKEPKWIPVTERLPDMSESDWVIGIASGDRMINAIVMVGYDHETDTWYLSEFPETTVKVSHWMPLPEPPETLREAEV